MLMYASPYLGLAGCGRGHQSDVDQPLRDNEMLLYSYPYLELADCYR